MTFERNHPEVHICGVGGDSSSHCTKNRGGPKGARMRDWLIIFEQCLLRISFGGLTTDLGLHDAHRGCSSEKVVKVDLITGFRADGRWQSTVDELMTASIVLSWRPYSFLCAAARIFSSLTCFLRQLRATLLTKTMQHNRKWKFSTNGIN